MTEETRVHVLGKPVDDYPATPPEARRGKVLRVTVVGEEILAKPCKEATTEFGTPELDALIDDMFATMQVAEGVGLAANQVDVDLRLFVYDCPDDDGVRHVGHILNPVLDDLPVERRSLVENDEGCLSVPGPYAPVSRPDVAVVRGFDKSGAPLVLEGHGFFARCLQHETDHLNGRLYIDRLAARRRKTVLKEMAERQDEIFQRRAARADARDA
ncbi:MAG: peptide deformylase [Hamadaea sp.]|nr:peptide deformylase [Hamadaea sp.]